MIKNVRACLLNATQTSLHVLRLIWFFGEIIKSSLKFFGVSSPSMDSLVLP
jgi:hypothetical protein